MAGENEEKEKKQEEKAEIVGLKWVGNKNKD